MTLTLSARTWTVALPAAALALATVLVATTPANGHAQEAVEAIQNELDLRLLFVQSPTHGSFADNVLTLEGVGTTLVFTDRPARMDGHLLTEKFVGGWAAGQDSFEADQMVAFG